MLLIQVNRNGAKTRMEMAKQFAKHPNFKNLPLHEVIKSIRYYESIGCFNISDCFLTLKHYC